MRWRDFVERNLRGQNLRRQDVQRKIYFSIEASGMRWNDIEATEPIRQKDAGINRVKLA